MERNAQKRKITFDIAGLPVRPKRVEGNYGQDMRFLTNYYRIQFKERDQIFYQYQMTFEPELPKDARRTIRKIVTEIKEDLQKKMGYFVERGTMLWTFRKPKENLVMKCSITNDNGEPQDYTVFLKKTTEFTMSGLEAGGKDSQQIIQVLNSILKKRMGELGMVEIGRNSKFYDKNAINDDKVAYSDLKVWRGFTTSIQIVSGFAYLMVDFSTRVLRSRNLLACMRNMNRDEQRDLIGQTVLAPYGNYRTYKIEGFDPNLTASSTFQKNGVIITYMDYFRKAYGVSVTEPDQPLIITSIKKKVVSEGGIMEEISEEINVLPELVYLTGMTDDERRDRKLMQALANFTKLEPADRINCNQDLLNRRLITQNQIFTIESRESQMEGQILHPPTFVLSEKEDQPINGQFNLRSKILSPCDIRDWLLVYSDKDNRPQDKQECDNLLRALEEAGRTFGITLSRPGYCYANGSLDSFLDKIEEDVKKHGKPLLVMTFLNPYESKFYTDLKHLLYLKLGVPHQNVLRKSLLKNTISVASNILLQMNAKLGEPLWRIVQSLKEVRDRSIAIGGIAIYHKLINRKDSCAAFVGTIDKELTRYFSFAKLMEQNVQRIQPMQDLMLKWLKAFFKKNNRLPDTLIIFRDGVGEGQIVSILDVELPALEKAVQSAGEKVKIAYKPEVIFVLANKKVPQRMFEESERYQRGRGGRGASTILNPPPGSVISGPMSRYNYDFFMVPQWVNQGTATPTHYVVVHNNSKLSEQALITLTYHQCYNYFNWKGAIRIPASLMYANKLATLVGEHLKSTPTDESLSSKLYSL